MNREPLDVLLAAVAAENHAEAAATAEVAIAVVLLSLIAITSIWEDALRRSTRLRVKQLAQRQADTTVFERWVANPTRYIRTLLITSITLSVWFVLDVLLIVRAVLPQCSMTSQLVLTGISATLALLVLGKVLPRNWGRGHAEAVVPGAVRALDVLATVYTVALILPLLEWLVTAWLHLTKTRREPEIDEMTEEELRLLIDVSDKEGALEPEEREMIVSVVEFGDTLVKEIMTPRTAFVSLESSATLDEVLAVVLETGHSRIPVYTGGLDQIDGILNTKDLFRWIHRHPEDEPFDLRRLLRPAQFVPESKNVNDLLKQLQTAKMHMAIVVDEYGGTSGLVTIEDILEEIVGEIQDEFDEEDQLYTRQEDGSVIADARIDLWTLAEDLDIHLPVDEDEADYETLGGFLCAHFGSVPAKGQVLCHDGVRLTVIDADERRVKAVHIKRVPFDEDAGSAGHTE